MRTQPVKPSEVFIVGFIPFKEPNPFASYVQTNPDTNETEWMTYWDQNCFCRPFPQFDSLIPPLPSRDQLIIEAEKLQLAITQKMVEISGIIFEF